ncbi:MAG: hypothetical protein M1818_005645 [Claussenomyces sp. TS43310]|nr:MAG: hypothetical protein M1818_005645 [Claussenomyces sp. TS43310]
MDMGSMGGASSDAPLNDTGIDFSNPDDAATFLGEILDDTDFQVDGNRLRAAAANRSRPATPANIFTKSIACITAILREVSYGQYTPTAGALSLFRFPPLGTLTLIVGYLGWVMLLEFVDNDVKGAQHYTALGVRAAWLAVAQVPLLLLLAGKNNLIGLVSGISYERLNILHRWVARVLLLLATLHVAFLHASWNAYGLRPLEYATDSCVPTGWATYGILLWMNISTMAPIRNLCYEFFVVQHILTFIGFIIAVMFHLPSTALYSRVYIYIPIGLYVVDRLSRSARYTYNNLHPAQARLTAMEGGVTKICVQSRQIKNWSPGSHVFLSIPKFGIGQSHPVTIASIPSSHGGDLVFLLKRHRGFTSRVHRSAESLSASLIDKESPNVEQTAHLSLLDGPYGQHADFATFESVLLIAGSTGVSFTIPILLDIASRASKQRLPVRRIRFLWIIKNTSWTSWVSSELETAFQMLLAAGIEFEVDIHITCDDNLASDIGGVTKECGCACDKSLGPCCCVNIEEPDDEIRSIRDNEEFSTQKEAGVTNLEYSTATSWTPLRADDDAGIRNRVLPCAMFHSGRPNFDSLIWRLLEQAEGETGVALCGPLGLSSQVRRSIVRCSDERAVHKGSGAQGIFLHTECYGW